MYKNVFQNVYTIAFHALICFRIYTQRLPSTSEIVKHHNSWLKIPRNFSCFDEWVLFLTTNTNAWNTIRYKKQTFLTKAIQDHWSLVRFYLVVLNSICVYHTCTIIAPNFQFGASMVHFWNGFFNNFIQLSVINPGSFRISSAINTIFISPIVRLFI